MTPPRRVPRGGGRDALIEAAVAVIGEHGLEGATVRRIAEHAGVNNGLITHHFGSRDGLVLAAARFAVDRHLAVVRTTIDFALDAAVRDRLVETFEKDPLTQLFIYETTIAAQRHPALREGIRALYEELVDDMQASLEERGYPHSRPFARSLIAAIDGLALQQLAITTPDEISRAYDRIGSLMRALRAPDSALTEDARRPIES